MGTGSAYFRWLYHCSTLHSTGGASTWLFQTQGRGKDWLFASLLGSFFTVASFVAGLPFGPAGVAIAYSVAVLFIGMPNYLLFCRTAGTGDTADLWSGFFRYLPLWIVVCGVTWLVHLLFVNSPLLGAIGRLRSRWPSRWSDLIYLVPSMRRVAFSLVDILLELKSRISFFNAK